MKFIGDAQLPRLLAIRLCELGHVSVCPLDYRPSAVMTALKIMGAICLRECRLSRLRLALAKRRHGS